MIIIKIVEKKNGIVSVDISNETRYIKYSLNEFPNKEMCDMYIEEHIEHHQENMVIIKDDISSCMVINLDTEYAI